MNRKQSQQTALRLAKSLAQAGSDATQPSPTVLATLWAQGIMGANRPQVLCGLRVACPNGAGFDYGPVGLTLLRWIVINRFNGLGDPAASWIAALALHAAGGGSEIEVPVADDASDADPFPSAPKASIPPGARIHPVAPKKTVQSAPKAKAAPQAAQPAPVAPAPIVVTPAAPAPAAGPSAPVFDEAEVSAVVQEAMQHAPPDLTATPVFPYVSPAEKAHPEWTWKPAAEVFGEPSLRGNVAVWPRVGTPEANRCSHCAEAAAPCAWHARVPKLDPHFLWDVEHLQWAIFAANESPAKGIWCFGNRGSGKTEFSKMFAAALGRPHYGVTFSRTMEPMDFLGDDAAAGGNSVWRDGTVLIGLRSPVPAVILLDEITYGQSSHISGPLNEIVHPQCSYTVPRTGERIDFNNGHLFMGADNTNGSGDPTEMFVGTNVMNRATVDRFAVFRRFTYLPPAKEQALLQDKAQCSREIAMLGWGVLDALRKKVDSDLLADPPSLREAMAFCCALRAGFDQKDAFESCFVSKYMDDEQEEMRVTFTAFIEGK